MIFTSYAIDSDESWARHVRTGAFTSGIYVLIFSDDEKRAYVGQSRNLVNRLATHRRHHSGLVQGLRIAPCDPDDLDDAERAVIGAMEADGWRLTNKMLAGKPMGDDIVLREVAGHVVPLPWERPERLVGMKPPSRSSRCTDHQRVIYDRAQRQPWFRDLVEVLGAGAPRRSHRPGSDTGCLTSLDREPSAWHRRHRERPASQHLEPRGPGDCPCS